VEALSGAGYRVIAYSSRLRMSCSERSSPSVPVVALSAVGRRQQTDAALLRAFI
jgi:hypothetical protein